MSKQRWLVLVVFGFTAGFVLGMFGVYPTNPIFWLVCGGGSSILAFTWSAR